MTEQWPSHQIVGRPSFASAPWSHDRMQTLEDVQTWQGRKLVDADGGLNVTQVIFETTFRNLIVPVAFFRVSVPRIFANSVQA